MNETTEKLKRWRGIFGIDTPVEIDRAYHQLCIALRKCQTEEAKGHIEQAKDHLEHSDWMMKNESGSGSKKN